MATTSGAHVRLTQLEKSFGERKVLRDLSVEFTPGDVVAVVGRSGSGKSTLLRLLSGLEEPSGGTLTLSDESGSLDHDVVRVVFQEPRLLPWRTVLANVMLSGKAVAPARALEVLAQVGLVDRAGDYPGVLSGGQKQRVALARALVHEPKMLLLDEPFGALDALTRIEAQQLVEQLWSRARFTTVLVTHDVEEAVLLSDRVLVLEAGAIVDDLEVRLPRPRSREQPEIGRLTAQLLDRILGRPSADAIRRDEPGKPRSERDELASASELRAGLVVQAP
jgi:sulfonate transport system ATP-binding protein